MRDDDDDDDDDDEAEDASAYPTVALMATTRRRTPVVIVLPEDAPLIMASACFVCLCCFYTHLNFNFKIVRALRHEGCAKTPPAQITACVGLWEYSYCMMARLKIMADDK